MDDVKEQVKVTVKCTDYLKPAPNHSGANGYCCPLCGSGTHGAKSTGAVKYYENTNTWYCHACGHGGDVIDLYQAETGKDYTEALNDLAKEIGLEIRDHKQNKRRAELHTIEKNSADYTAYYEICRDRLDDPAAINYLQARGISIETAKACGIGFDPAADPAGAPGAIRSEYKKHPCPRIIAPCDKQFYIARSIDPNTPPAFKAPNPKGSSTSIFNAAALNSESEEPIFVVEGIFDALSIIETGHQAIALNGKINGRLLLDAVTGAPQKKFIVCFDIDSGDNGIDTDKKAEILSNALNRAGHKSVYECRITSTKKGTCYHDANDALIADRKQFEFNIYWALEFVQFVATYDDLDRFLDTVQTEAYKPHATGLNFIDALLSGGIVSQSLLLLTAAPGAGKTTLAQQLAETIAKNREPVIYFNFEMSKEQMLAKAISARYYQGNGGDKSTLDILQGYNWTDPERTEIEAIIKEYRRDSYPYIKYNPDGINADLDNVLNYLNEHAYYERQAGRKAPAVIIDYLHLLTTHENIEDAELLKRAVTGLKKYAIENNTFVIAIIAANRDSTKAGKLTLASGRDSSNLEYTADYEISLNYEDIDNGTVNPQNQADIERLQAEHPRRMILRALKTRLAEIPKAQHVAFDAKHNIFYATRPDLQEADDAPAFDQINNVVKTIISH